MANSELQSLPIEAAGTARLATSLPTTLNDDVSSPASEPTLETVSEPGHTFDMPESGIAAGPKEEVEEGHTAVDVEHIPVRDDPRLWSNRRKVSIDIGSCCAHN